MLSKEKEYDKVETLLGDKVPSQLTSINIRKIHSHKFTP